MADDDKTGVLDAKETKDETASSNTSRRSIYIGTKFLNNILIFEVLVNGKSFSNADKYISVSANSKVSIVGQGLSSFDSVALRMGDEIFVPLNLQIFSNQISFEIKDYDNDVLSKGGVLDLELSSAFNSLFNCRLNSKLLYKTQKQIQEEDDKSEKNKLSKKGGSGGGGGVGGSKEVGGGNLDSVGAGLANMMVESTEQAMEGSVKGFQKGVKSQIGSKTKVASKDQVKSLNKAKVKNIIQSSKSSLEEESDIDDEVEIEKKFQNAQTVVGQGGQNISKTVQVGVEGAGNISQNENISRSIEINKDGNLSGEVKSNVDIKEEDSTEVSQTNQLSSKVSKYINASQTPDPKAPQEEKVKQGGVVKIESGLNAEGQAQKNLSSSNAQAQSSQVNQPSPKVSKYINASQTPDPKAPQGEKVKQGGVVKIESGFNAKNQAQNNLSSGAQPQGFQINQASPKVQEEIKASITKSPKTNQVEKVKQGEPVNLSSNFSPKPLPEMAVRLGQMKQRGNVIDGIARKTDSEKEEVEHILGNKTSNIDIDSNSSENNGAVGEKPLPPSEIPDIALSESEKDGFEEEESKETLENEKNIVNPNVKTEKKPKETEIDTENGLEEDGEEDEGSQETLDRLNQAKQIRQSREGISSFNQSEADSLVNKEINMVLMRAVLWVWLVALPSFGLSLLLGAIVGDIIWIFGPGVFKRFARAGGAVAKRIPGVSVLEKELDLKSVKLELSGKVKVNIIVMNVAVAILLFGLIVFVATIIWGFCNNMITYPIRNFTNAGEICKVVDQSFVGRGLSYATTTSGRQFQASYNVPGELLGTSFWSNEINSAAQKNNINACILRVVVQKESAGQPSVIGCDCRFNGRGQLCYEPASVRNYYNGYRFNWDSCSYGIGITQWTIYPKGGSGYRAWRDEFTPSRNIVNGWYTVNDLLDPLTSLDLTGKVFGQNLARANGDVRSAFSAYVGQSAYTEQFVNERMALYNLCISQE